MRAMQKSLLLIAPLALAACTSQQLYFTGQQWQKQECVKLQDRDERGRCEKSAATSFERSKAESDAAKKPPQ